MGLDMYLEAEVSVSKYDEGPESTHVRGAIKVAYDSVLEKENCEIGMKVVLPLAYWRKANHIHRWFVQNCQDGVDECQRADVSREQLATLHRVCTEVLLDHSKAPKLLPTEDGFFFGGTDYGEYYYETVEYTVKALDRILKELPKGADVYYQSSW